MLLFDDNTGTGLWLACPYFFVLVEQGRAVNGFNEYYAAYRMCNIRFGGACSPHD